MAIFFSLNKFTRKILTFQIKQSSHSISTSIYKFQSEQPKVTKPKEVQVEVPWGHVAGKWYGSENVRPIVMLHGWQDNAGTFDTLVPLLPNHLSYLSIDLPGHGLSSRIPHGMYYTVMNFIHVLNIMKKHYGWEKLSLCSHSMGAQISNFYAALYPNECDLLICLDALLKPHASSVEDKIKYVEKIGRDFLLLDKLNRSNTEPPTYTFDEIIKRWADQSKLSIDDVKHLAKRGIIKSKVDPTRFYFSRDIRLKIMEFTSISIPESIIYKILEQITAPFLFIKANKSDEFLEIDRYTKCFEIMKVHNPQFEWMQVKGGHHCHLTDPKLISDKISSFISKHRQPNN